MRPFVLVMAYFFFHTMSGFAPVRSNMVNMCKALGMKYDPKTIVVSTYLVLLTANTHQESYHSVTSYNIDVGDCLFLKPSSTEYCK